MVDRRVVQEWLDKADEDFGFANSVLDDTKYYAQLCFHYHQAAEKYLKAFIVAKELDFVKRHDLVFLLDICRQADPSFDTLLVDCKFLNRFYIDTRYPVHWSEGFTRNDALKAREAVERVKSSIQERLSDTET